MNATNSKETAAHFIHVASDFVLKALVRLRYRAFTELCVTATLVHYLGLVLAHQQ